MLAAALAQPFCPSITGTSLAGVDEPGEPQLLANLNFPFELTYTWTDNGADVLGFPAGVDMNNFEVSVEGAAMKGVSVGEFSTSFDVEFPETGNTVLKVTLTDTTGTCSTSEVQLDRYVYWKHTPLVPLIFVFIVTPLTREVFFSLGLAGLLAWMILMRHPWFGFLRFFDTGLIHTLTGDFAHIMLFLFLMGAVVGASIVAGGVQGLGEGIVRFIKDSFLGQAVVYLMGWAFFLDDYANTIIVGTTLRSVTDKNRISREKLALLVDCTAAPIAGVMPLSTWIAFELGVLGDALDSVGFTADTPYNVFLLSIPKCFYSWYMLFYIAVIIVMNRDWGPMYWAEKRARATGEVTVGLVLDGQQEEQAEGAIEFKLAKKKDVPARWYNAAVPYFVLVCLFVVLLFYSGATGAHPDHVGGVMWDASARDIVGNANSWATLEWVTGFTICFQLIFYMAQYSKMWGGCLLWPAETIAAGIEGSKEYYAGAVALMLAITFADTMKDLQIAQYLVQSLSSSLSEAELSALTFVLCAIFSAATGSSWGTMTVFFPICIPLATAVGSIDDTDLVSGVAAAVLGGALWGDHCSPISDTTILSAAASQVPLLDHVKTQLPYAGMLGVMAVLLGYLPNGAGCPAGVCLLLGFIIVPLMHFGLTMIPKFGGPLEVYDPDTASSIGEGFPGVMQSLKTARCSSQKSKSVEDPTRKEAAGA